MPRFIEIEFGDQFFCWVEADADIDSFVAARWPGSGWSATGATSDTNPDA